MHKLLEKLDKELHAYADKEGDLTPAEWKCVYDAIDARKNLLTSMAMEGEDQYGNYSNGWMSSGQRRMSGMMDPDLSYTDGYSRGSYGRGGYSSSYNQGRMPRRYSGHGQDPFIENLYMALDDARTSEQRQAIQAMIDKYCQ